MKLRKLALQGYKTFASKTEFVFDGGITAIVGPNGSGKSNIADALRWVLGEQSYSILRGKRTTDMIFAGSRHRARAGMAQVTITLDNSDNWLPIDYAEVEIARRAHRSGENEYLLNGQHVRLRDITQLLATSGLAERTYTIIGQGMVDQALSLRSDERRALFEEAAGINHYKQRRAETLRRLEETERNLQRVHDILAELRPRLSSLKRQAQRTQHYEQISADLRELLRFWYGFKWEQAKSDLRLARQAAAAAESGWEQSRAELLRLQEQADRLQQRMNELQQQIVASRAARDSLREQLELSRRDRAILRERREAVQRQIAEIEQDLPLLLDQQTIAQAEVASAADDLAAAQEQLAEQQERRRQFQESSQTRREEIARRQQALRRAEDDLRRRRTTAAQAQGQLSQLRERLAEAGGSEDDDRVTGELAGLAEEIARYEATAASAQDALNDLRRRRGEEQRLRREQIEQLKGMRRELREREDGLSRRQHELARLEERVNLLEQSRRRSAPAVPPEQIVGQLVGLLHIPAAYETAITAALGERLSAWVLADQEALWASIREARRRTEESATALLLAALGRSGNGRVTGAEARPALPSENGVIGWADEVVNWESNLTSLASRLLGSLLLVEDEATAYRLAETLPPGHLVVTPDGFVAHTDGLIELHRPRPSGALNREAEWRAGQAQLESARAETAERETAVRELRAAIERLQTEIDKRQEEERQLGGPENEAAQQLSEAQRKVERARQQVGYLRRQQETQAAERRRLGERIEQTETLLREHEAALEQLEAQVNEAGAGLAALPVNETQQQQEAQQQAVMAAQTVVAGRQAVVDSRRTTLSQIDNQLGRLRQRLTHLGEQLAQLRRDEETATSRSLEEELAALDEAIDPLQAELNAGAQTLARLQEETAVRQRHAHELENQYTQQRVRLAQLESQVAGLQERIRADLGLVALSYDAEQTGPTPLPMHDVVDQLPRVEELPPDIEETINQYRGQLHRMGPINPDAPAELAEVEERYDFLSRQVEDLTTVDARLRQVIAELDYLTSRAFAETVEKVNSVFDETFRQLFGGGSGRLVVTDPDDLTRSGVEIVARLPNRREQALALLSGGERSLTAAALIFSLLRVSPPPFCVLDEVDAALDEANINRFRDLVRELSQQIQFVLITHNRGTVQAAATIYGVSMQPDSASQVISIKPEEYARE